MHAIEADVIPPKGNRGNDQSKKCIYRIDPAILPKDPVADRIKDQEHPLWVEK